MAVDKRVETRLLTEWHYPKGAFFNRVVAKETIIQNAKVASKSKQIFLQEVKQVNWVFLIKESNTNITEYVSPSESFREIDYIHVEIKDPGAAKSVSDIVFNSIPSPVILEIRWQDSEDIVYSQWYAAEYEVKHGVVHKTDPILEEDVSAYDAKFDFDRLPTNNLKNLYNRYLSNIEAINYQSKYGNRTDNKDIVEINAQLKSLEAVIAKTSKEAKKEKQINKRAKLVKKARDLQVELDNLKRRAVE
ncbi:DUF4391 domain-containing protein [Weissella cibaria]|uniref:DUF4391 domain-containing protein n=1 Tax=Weissella cibaria TaxID=137591 RepID=UPI001FF5AB6E|nr:DUF4391 domain-containing protein [Weissella cibaria]UOX35757.1 DUF4391 domain-containing protein [Weissella cibaria]